MDNHLPATPAGAVGPDRRGRPAPLAGRSMLLLSVLAVLVAFWSGAAVAAVTSSQIADALEIDGRLIEVASDASVDQAADRANGAGIAFAWLDRSGDDTLAVTLADEVVEDLGVRGSRYHTVLVVVGNGFAASSLTRSQFDLDGALDAALPGFADGDMGRGLDAFVSALASSGAESGTPTTVPDGSGSSDSGGGIGFGTILLVVALAGGGFLLVRRLLRGRQEREQAEIDLAEDRAEIEEQLKNNADRVIALGDRVIAKGDRELIVLYEEASAAYQDVSQRIDGAETAAEIDELDDRIDEAEWQFEVIEASLEGRPRPRPPVPDDVLTGDPGGGAETDVGSSGRERPGTSSAPERPGTSSAPERPGASSAPERPGASSAPERPGGGLPPPPGSASDGQAQPPVITSPRTGRSSPRSTGRRRGGGGLGGVLAGGLGGILADVVLGGGLGGSSRRTRRRTTRGGIGSSRGGRSGGTGGGLGGGVLRRGGGSSRRPRSRRSSGGRSLGGRSRSRGGRRL